MSTLYNLEPQPTAKVLLNTTSGDLLLELFAKQTPITSRNFLQLCLDGYYNGTIFHRLVPKFVIQGGDPTGTGEGGESAYDGEPFQDEFHSRLKFNRRGLLGMANTGKKDDNGSQFFLTLDNTPELNGKNTMFGRIVGDTIYNLMRMGESDLVDEGSERPLYPTKIISTEILANPFEDMVKRAKVAQRTTEEKKAKPKAKRKAGKNVLSFVGDEEGGEELAPVAKKTKLHPQFVSAGKEAPTDLNTTLPKAPKQKPAKPVHREPSRSPSPFSRKKPEASATKHSKQRSLTRSPSPVTPPEEVEKVSSLLERTNAQIAELKASMKRNLVHATEAPKKMSALEAMIPSTSTRGRRRGQQNGQSTADEQRSLDLLASFRKKLDAVPAEKTALSFDKGKERSDKNGDNGVHPPAPEPVASIPATAVPGNDEDEAALCDLHFIANCQSCTKWNEHTNIAAEEEEVESRGWMSHALTFEKDRLGKDLEWKRKNEQELVVIDPRERAKEIREENKRGKGDGRGSGNRAGGKGDDRKLRDMERDADYRRRERR